MVIRVPDAGEENDKEIISAVVSGLVQEVEIQLQVAGRAVTVVQDRIEERQNETDTS